MRCSGRSRHPIPTNGAFDHRPTAKISQSKRHEPSPELLQSDGGQSLCASINPDTVSECPQCCRVRTVRFLRQECEPDCILGSCSVQSYAPGSRCHTRNLGPKKKGPELPPRPFPVRPEGPEVVFYFSVFRYSITCWRAAGSLSPAKVILVPGTTLDGAVRYLSSVASSQVRLAPFIASLKA